MPEKKLISEKKEKMGALASDLRQKMQEIDNMGKKIREKGAMPSPRETMQLLEEIHVPSLKLLKEAH
jgi:hypothetical protein